jgi:hypothetical protein
MKELESKLPQESQDKWIWIIQESFLEVFARMSTGVIFIVSAVIAIQPLKEVYENVKWLTETLNEVKSGFFAIFAIFLIFFTYLIGLILSRLEIKTADRASFQRRAKCLYWDLLKAKAKSESKSKIQILLMYPKWVGLVAWHYCYSMKLFDEYPNLKFQEQTFQQWLIHEFACANKAECEFPYLRLREYLKIRGLNDLAGLVNWDGETDASKKKRTRNFIDLVKLRVRFFGGDRVMHIVRNEAHVRLLSSTWWAARIDTWISIFVIIVYTVTTFVTHHKFQFGAIYSTVAIFVIAGLIRLGITNYLHDLRMRELIQILGTDCLLRKIYKQEYPELTFE